MAVRLDSFDSASCRINRSIVVNVLCILSQRSLSTSWLLRDVDMRLAVSATAIEDGDCSLRLNYWRSKLFFLGMTQKLKKEIWSGP